MAWPAGRCPQILRDAGFDEGFDEERITLLMAGYDETATMTTIDLSSAQQRRRIAEREYNEDTEIYPEDFGPLP